MKDMSEYSSLSYSEFASLFKRAFKHVHIREYKNVSGKCDICERLTAMMKSFKLPQDREIIRAYRSLHRYVFIPSFVSFFSIFSYTLLIIITGILFVEKSICITKGGRRQLIPMGK